VLAIAKSNKPIKRTKNSLLFSFLKHYSKLFFASYWGVMCTGRLSVLNSISFIFFILLFCTALIGFSLSGYFYIKACRNTKSSNSISNGFGFFINLYSESAELTERGIAYRSKFIRCLVLTAMIIMINYLITSIGW